ncbi:MAG: lectin-like protein [Candidatus Limivicinus sp.]|jgi:hypothetical protein
MKKYEFEADRAVGSSLVDFDRQKLCEFAVKLCDCVKEDAGTGAYRGGIFPENISVDENGNPAIGPAAAEDWTGQELDFLPPELYWNGRPGPASDVYSIGMLLYYAVNGGRLPFEGECRDPQLRRMGGDEFGIPAAAGRRLGAIIKKATSFKAADRYQSLDELRVLIESCLKNLYLNGAPCAETIFKKSDDDLSEIEKLMVGIIENDEDRPLNETGEKPEEIPEEAQAEEETSAEAGEPEEEEPGSTEEIPESEAGETEEIFSDETAEEEPEETEYAEEETDENGLPIPKLYEEKNPELEPVILTRQPDIRPAVRYAKTAEEEKRVADDVKKRRRRPVAVILVMCALLVVVAIAFNAMLKDMSPNHGEAVAPEEAAAGNAAGGEKTGAEAVPEEDIPEEIQAIKPDSTGKPFVDNGLDTGDDPYALVWPEEGETGTDTEKPEGGAAEPGYKLFTEDISWTDARDKCREMGGHLVVINDADEFNAIAELAEQNGASMLWIGGHRENGKMIWEDDKGAVFEQWAKGEPSFVDTSDGAAEDYVLMWNNNGWYYNDSRNDPCAEFPQWYGGKMSYVCEFEG